MNAKINQPYISDAIFNSVPAHNAIEIDLTVPNNRIVFYFAWVQFSRKGLSNDDLSRCSKIHHKGFPTKYAMIACCIPIGDIK